MMREQYSFKDGKRGAVLPATGKTRVTIMIDDDVIETFRLRAEANGRGYQTLMNETLRASLDPDAAPVTLRDMRVLLAKIGAKKVSANA
jgi:uncharacterized protein (DUF4415 family)